MSYALPRDKVIHYPAERLRTFRLYSFEWIDNLNFILEPQGFLGERAAEYVAVVRELFLGAGWEGDGDIGLLWLPTFVFPECLDMEPEGVVAWHAKQHTDGRSFLLSPRALPFEELVAR